MTSNESQRGAFSAQQYRVIADRDKGDDPRDVEQRPGDRLIYSETVGVVLEGPILVRIERPVLPLHCLSTAHHEEHDWGGGNWCPGFGASDERPSVPTRAQIADVLADHYAWGRADEEDRAAADAVLALLNGADRD